MYISFCIDNVMTRRQVKTFPKQKPWCDATVKALLLARDSALRSGDGEGAYRKAKSDLTRGRL